MNSNSANLFNFAVGVFGFVTTVASVALFCRSYLPGAQMKILDELLKETRTIFEIADADGLFPSDAFRKTSLTMLICSEESSALLRERTYNATTTIQEYLALFKGLTQSIMQLSDRVKNLRSCLISTSEKERRNRRAGNAGHSAHSYDSRLVGVSVSQSISVPPVESTRARASRVANRGPDRRRGRSASCPSVLREDLERPKEICHQDAAQDGALSEEIKSSVILLETIEDLSRSSTLIDTPAQNIIYKTLGQFCDWTTSLHPKVSISDDPAHDHDIARLPV